MINKVILIGRLGADPEVKQTKNGDNFANLSLATNKKIKDNEKTTWHKVVVLIQELLTQWVNMLRKVHSYISKVRLKLDLIKMLMIIKDMLLK